MLNQKGVSFSTLCSLGMLSVCSRQSVTSSRCVPLAILLLHLISLLPEFDSVFTKAESILNQNVDSYKFSFRHLQTDCNFFNAQKM